jgi:RNA polymerase sigma-70 factor (ECF subfamily)
MAQRRGVRQVPVDAPRPMTQTHARHICRSCPIPLPSASSRAFAELLPELRRTARRFTRSPEDADDLVQEALLRVWARVAVTAQGTSDAAPVSDLRAYAFATLRHAAARRGPPPGSDDELSDTIAAPPDAASAHRAMRQALAALDALPRDQARLLRMRALEGRSYAEIARHTGLPLGTVTSRLARGRAALRLKLGLPPGAPVADLFRAD